MGKLAISYPEKPRQSYRCYEHIFEATSHAGFLRTKMLLYISSCKGRRLLFLRPFYVEHVRHSLTPSTIHISEQPRSKTSSASKPSHCNNA